MPSLRVTARAVRNASRSDTRTHRSTIDGVERAGPEVLADPLDEVRARVVARVDGALGVGADDRDAGFRSFR